MKYWLLGLIGVCWAGTVQAQRLVFCDNVYTDADQPPEFKGGEDALMAWMGKNISIPSTCVKPGEELADRLVIQFTIDTTGKVVSVTFSDPLLSQSCGVRLQRAFLQMEGWTPAVHQGKKVCYRYRIPLHLEWNR